MIYPFMYILSHSVITNSLWHMKFSSPDSSVHGVFHARILEWAGISSSRRTSWPRDQTHIACVSYIAGRFFTAEPLGRPIYVSGILKLPTIIVFLSTSPFMSVNICLIHWGAPILGAYIYNCMSSWTDLLIIMECPSLSLVAVLILKSICLIHVLLLCFPLISICMVYLFPSLHFQSVCVSKSEMGLL